MNPVQRRLKAVRTRIRRQKLAGLLVTDPFNVRYVTGFTGDDSIVLLSPRGGVFITDSRYTEQAARELRGSGIALVRRRRDIITEAAAQAKKLRLDLLGFEPKSLTVDAHRRLASSLGGFKLAPAGGIVEELRIIKDSTEVALIRKALKIAETAFQDTRALIRPGMTERDIAAELDFRMRKLGADAAAFPTIIAVNASSSKPHARPGSRKLTPGGMILIDWGARVEGYNSDLTRVLFLDRIPPHWQGKYEAVLAAQKAAIRLARPGIGAAVLDRAARRTLKRHRLGKRFGHGLGHGVGMQIHEGPAIGAKSDLRLKPGMVLTVEPGVYFPGRGGIRIEDMILVTRSGHEILSTLPRGAQDVVL